MEVGKKNIDYLIKNYNNAIIINISKYKNKYPIVYGEGTIFFKECFRILEGRYTTLKITPDTKILCWIFPESDKILDYLEILMEETKTNNFLNLYDQYEQINDKNEIRIKINDFTKDNYTEHLTNVSRKYFT